MTILVVPEPYATAVVRPFVAPETGTVAPRDPTLPLTPLLPLEFELLLSLDVSELPDLPDEPDLPPPPFPPPPFRRYSRWALGSVTPGTNIVA